MEGRRFHQRVTRWRLQATSHPPISQTQNLKNSESLSGYFVSLWNILVQRASQDDCHDDVLDGDDEDALVLEWLGDDDA